MVAMENVAHWSLAPFQVFLGWQRTALRARQINPMLCLAWYVLGTPVMIFACLLAIVSILAFPFVMLAGGFEGFSSDPPGIAWYSYAAGVFVFWVTILVINIVAILRRLRARIVDIETFVFVASLVLGLFLAMFYLCKIISGVRPDIQL
jgi:hypothetical protein